MTEKSHQGRYAARGVSSTKQEVHATVDTIDRGLFPGAFCKITEDYLTGDPTQCNVIHSDGSGTKSNVAYLHFRETGEASVFRGIAQDSVVMNVDDLLCVGVTGGVLLSSTVNRNARRFPGAALAHLIQGTEDFLARLRDFGFSIQSGGGETADVGDLVSTVTVDSCATAILNRDAVITGEKIRPGLTIIGISSAGQCDYEDVPNSGIGSNGLTSARHDLLAPYYRDKYPETYDATTDKELVYCGPHRLEDLLPAGDGMTVGQALLSPTRTYAPVVAKLITDFPGQIRGLVHCSGGGQTKCLRFGRKVHFIKDSLLPIPPVFEEIQRASKSKWKEMYQVYNMGHRLEVYCPKTAVKHIVAAIESFGLEARPIGRTVKSEQPNGDNHLTLYHGKRALKYTL